VVNLHKDELLYTIPKYPKAKESYLVSSDGQTLVRTINASRHFIEVWHEGEQVHSLYGHEAEIGAIARSVLISKFSLVVVMTKVSKFGIFRQANSSVPLGIY
jgi:hypothetical protein